MEGPANRWSEELRRAGGATAALSPVALLERRAFGADGPAQRALSGFYEVGNEALNVPGFGRDILRADRWLRDTERMEETAERRRQDPSAFIDGELSKASEAAASVAESFRADPFRSVGAGAGAVVLGGIAGTGSVRGAQQAGRAVRDVPDLARDTRAQTGGRRRQTQIEETIERPDTPESRAEARREREAWVDERTRPRSTPDEDLRDVRSAESAPPDGFDPTDVDLREIARELNREFGGAPSNTRSRGGSPAERATTGAERSRRRAQNTLDRSEMTGARAADELEAAQRQIARQLDGESVSSTRTRSRSAEATAATATTARAAMQAEDQAQQSREATGGQRSMQAQRGALTERSISGPQPPGGILTETQGSTQRTGGPQRTTGRTTTRTTTRPPPFRPPQLRDPTVRRPPELIEADPTSGREDVTAPVDGDDAEILNPVADPSDVIRGETGFTVGRRRRGASEQLEGMGDGFDPMRLI